MIVKPASLITGEILIAVFDNIRSKAKAYTSGKIMRDIEEAVQAVRKGA